MNGVGAEDDPRQRPEYVMVASKTLGFWVSVIRTHCSIFLTPIFFKVIIICLHMNRYEIFYKQAVTPEDMFMGLSGRDTSSASCEDMVVSLSFAKLQEAASWI